MQTASHVELSSFFKAELPSVVPSIVRRELPLRVELAEHPNHVHSHGADLLVIIGEQLAGLEGKGGTSQPYETRSHNPTTPVACYSPPNH